MQHTMPVPDLKDLTGMPHVEHAVSGQFRRIEEQTATGSFFVHAARDRHMETFFEDMHFPESDRSRKRLAQSVDMRADDDITISFERFHREVVENTPVHPFLSLVTYRLEDGLLPAA